MNTPNPLIPQGSLLEQKSKRKTNLVIAVFTILAVHVVLFSGLLMQGCKRDNTTTTAGKTNLVGLDTNFFPNTNVPMPPSSNYVSEAPTNPPPATNVTNPAEVPSANKEYKVVRGDNLWKIARDHGVSLTALVKANPNVDSRKLKPGQTIQIPSAPPATTTPTSPGGIVAADAGQNIYTVKAGDNLTTIAKAHRTTVPALMAENQLKSTRLNVGQKLKLPPPKAPAEPGTGAPATTNTNTARI